MISRRKLAVVGTMLGLCIAGVAARTAGAAQNAKPAPRDIEKTFDAAKLQSLSVEARVGRIEMRAGHGDKVVLRLHLEPKRKSGGLMRRGEWGDPSTLELKENTSGSELSLDVRGPSDWGHGDGDGIEETWTLEAPSRLAVRLHVNVGNVEVEGMDGGCDLKANVGDVRAHVMGGNITAEANVGSVTVESSTPSYGNVEMDANVGDVSFMLDDHRVSTPKPPGAGNHFTMEGPGRDRIRLKTNVGSTRLTIRKTA
jgi:hypothetical protein